jgi:hypothetical protein
VAAGNAEGLGPWSAVAAATTNAAPAGAVPAAVTNVTAANVTASAATVSFHPPLAADAPAAAGYLVAAFVRPPLPVQLSLLSLEASEALTEADWSPTLEPLILPSVAAAAYPNMSVNGTAYVLATYATVPAAGYSQGEGLWLGNLTNFEPLSFVTATLRGLGANTTYVVAVAGIGADGAIGPLSSTVAQVRESAFILKD